MVKRTTLHPKNDTTVDIHPKTDVTQVEEFEDTVNDMIDDALNDFKPPYKNLSFVSSISAEDFAYIQQNNYMPFVHNQQIWYPCGEYDMTFHCYRYFTFGYYSGIQMSMVEIHDDLTVIQYNKSLN